jgi:DNA-binding transcriptional LysR family regulator
MVAAGMGISFVPEMAAEPRSGCKFIPIEDEHALRRVGVVRLQSHFRSRPQREFMQHLSVCASLITRQNYSVAPHT